MTGRRNGHLAMFANLRKFVRKVQIKNQLIEAYEGCQHDIQIYFHMSVNCHWPNGQMQTHAVIMVGDNCST